jgi:uncharacterized membrane protein
MNASDFFSADDKEQIILAIREAEMNTSGEIRVHVELGFSGDLLDRAATVFARLGMHKTKERNGVLFYLAIEKKQFALLGDAGINRLVPSNFWDDIKAAMQGYFATGAFGAGLSTGIRMAGEQLKKHFPHQADDTDELSNEISFGQEA